MLLAELGALHRAGAFLPGTGSPLARTGRGDPGLGGQKHRGSAGNCYGHQILAGARGTGR